MKVNSFILCYIEEGELVIYVPQLDLTGVFPLANHTDLDQLQLKVYAENLLADKYSRYGSKSDYLGFLDSKEYFQDYSPERLKPKNIDYFAQRYPYISSLLCREDVKLSEYYLNLDIDGKREENSTLSDIV